MLFLTFKHNNELLNRKFIDLKLCTQLLVITRIHPFAVNLHQWTSFKSSSNIAYQANVNSIFGCNLDKEISYLILMTQWYRERFLMMGAWIKKSTLYWWTYTVKINWVFRNHMQILKIWHIKTQKKNRNNKLQIWCR